MNKALAVVAGIAVFVAVVMTWAYVDAVSSGEQLDDRTCMGKLYEVSELQHRNALEANEWQLKWAELAIPSHVSAETMDRICLLYTSDAADE